MAANNLRSVLWESFEWFLFFTLLLGTPGSVAAAEPSINPTTADQLKQLNDQTIIATHVSLDSEWDHFKDGAEKATWTLAGLWGWPVGDSQDWGIRFNLPFRTAWVATPPAKWMTMGSAVLVTRRLEWAPRFV